MLKSTCLLIDKIIDACDDLHRRLFEVLSLKLWEFILAEDVFGSVEQC